MNTRRQSYHGSRITTAWALRAAALCAVGLALTWVVAALLPQAHTRDAAALYGFMQLGRPRVIAMANFFANTLDSWRYAALAAGLIAVALARGRPRIAVAVGLSLSGSVLTSELLKPLLAHPHDAAGNRLVTAASWPSGHSTAAMCLALCAVLVAPARLRLAVAALGSVFAIVVSFSLLTLAWHLPSDVVGGYLLAGLWTALAVAALRAADARWPRQARAQRSRASALPGVGEMLVPIAVVGMAGALVVGAVLLRPYAVASFADAHRSLVVAGLVIAALAGALVSALAVALRR
jgi:membrane-associated phospholipid phosphatase